MGRDENQRKVFEFLFSHFENSELFSKNQLEAVTSWRGDTFDTYWSKQMRPFVVETPSEKYRLSESFRPYSTWEQFQKHVTQVRRVSSDYKELCFGLVRIYEFFMPLTNESHLRASLDALFYRDTVEARVKTIAPRSLEKIFPKSSEQESAANYTNRVCDWVSEHFGGYSVYHVNGRFRAGPLLTREKVGQSHPRYLVDETTAVTRFIFPCQNQSEADLVEFFFKELFVRAITEVVNGEDEIWMVETGLKNQLHIWRVDG